MARRRREPAKDPAQIAFEDGLERLRQSALFRRFLRTVSLSRHRPHDRAVYAVASSHGSIHVNPTARLEPQEWEWVLAHAMCHIGFGHTRAHEQPEVWNAACCLVVNRLLATLNIGDAPEGVGPADTAVSSTEEALVAEWVVSGIPVVAAAQGTAGRGPDMEIAPRRPYGIATDYQALFGECLQEAITEALSIAGGVVNPESGEALQTPARRALGWFISSYPLLGGIAAAFRLVEDHAVSSRLDIQVAAIDAVLQEIYVNPHQVMTTEEWRFVLAHEFLHAALHHQRRQGNRDAYLFNVACDFVINQWLVEMNVGTQPEGLLLDVSLAGKSAEEVYDQLRTDLRRHRRLATLRGRGQGDMLAPGEARPDVDEPSSTDLDAFYRRALGQGLIYHEAQGRGFLPAGLVEEIRALSEPPVPWDVGLATWFQDYFPLPDHQHTYARLSRRQSATPDIPRPARAVRNFEDARTFGVILDTSGSMDRHLLARCLGAIASYARDRDVPYCRLVMCDAAPYDCGYLSPDAIADRIRVRGRGGTALQPAVTLLEAAADFPDDGPVLILTDGWIEDQLRVRHEHAYLLPHGSSLPFHPKGPVFYAT